MAERKYVKLNVNMYEDTKSKIIDMKPERDLIHYLWTRFIALAGKVNLEGNLFMSKTIPYTIETLAIEFNRGAYQVKLALDVFMELEMIECAEDNVYRVKNFAKHQNIKVKETIEPKDKTDNINIEEVENKDIEKISDTELDKISDINFDKNKNVDTSKMSDSDNNYADNKKICEEENNNNLKANMPIVLEEKKNKNKNKNSSRSKSGKKNVTNINDVSSIDEIDEFNEFNEIDMDEGNEDNSLIQFYNGDEAKPLKEGEYVVDGWSF